MKESKFKDIKLSNIKGLLIFLVVFGHVMEIYKREFNELFVFIYAFHMPLFIFISGYFAKRVKISKIINLFLLYLIFQTFFNWFIYIIGDSSSFSMHYGTPIFHLWYIVSMVFWYIVGWFILKLKLSTFWKWMVFLLIIGGAFISRWYANDIEEIIQGYYSNFTTYTLSYQRTITFAPFFFAGFFVNAEMMRKIYNLITLRMIVPLGLLTVLVAFLYIQEAPIVELLYRGGFGTDRILNEGDGFSEYLLGVFFHYLLSSWLCFLILNLMQPRENVFTKWGDHSLTIFLFHPVVVFLLWKVDFFLEWNIPTKLMFFLCISVFTSYILGSNIFVKLTRPICNPYRSLDSIIKRKNEV